MPWRCLRSGVAACASTVALRQPAACTTARCPPSAARQRQQQRAVSTGSSAGLMRAVCLERVSGGDEALSSCFSLRSLPVPALRADELLVRVCCASVNPIDVMTPRGYGATLLQLASPLPRIAGMDATGVVVSTGQAVWRYRPGDRVWVSRDPRRPSGAFAEFIAVSVRELSPAPARLPLSSSACYPFIWTTLWTALVDRAALSPVPVSRLLSTSGQPEQGEERESQPTGEGDRPPLSLPALALSPQPGQPAAFVHGAGGPLGRLAVQTLQRWGFHVTATVRAQQDTAGLRQHTAAIIATQPEQQPAAATASASSASGSWWPPVPSPARPPSWLPSSCARASYRVFLDCVGGGSGTELSEGEEAAAVLLQPGVGCYVTLRGRMVQDVDERGLLAGGLRAVAGLVELKATFAARGLRYEAAVNDCNARALHYLALCLDTGGLQHHGSMQQQGDSWTGIERVIDALQHFETNRPQGKVVIAISNE